MRNDRDESPPRRSPSEGLLLALLAALFLFLRLRWVGHLLVWDEAMNLCAVRSFRAGAVDTFANWFWRHPPCFCLLMLLLEPLRRGFAERVELLTVFIGLLNLGVLYALNRRIFNRGVALWTAFFLAVLPGSIFFDVWIKRDPPAVTFGLLALLLVRSRRTLYAGLCLAVALLFKETAVFYVVASLAMVGVTFRGRAARQHALALLGTAVAGSSWWYLVLKNVAADTTHSAGTQWWDVVLRGVADHIQFARVTWSGWVHPWHYYVGMFPLQLGPAGLALALAGLAVLLAAVCRHAPRPGLCAFAVDRPFQALWPVFLLVPSYLLLSSLRSKVPWVVMGLFPAWATLQAVAAAAALSACRRVPGTSRRLCLGLLPALLVVLFLCRVHGRDYETVLRAVDKGQWRGAASSREAARETLRRMNGGDRALVTSFHYWRGLPPGHPCPVFASYFGAGHEVLLRPHTRPFQALVRDIRTHRLDWALVSPEPGPAADAVVTGFSRTFGIRPVVLRGALLFHTAPLYGNAGKSNEPVTR